MGLISASLGDVLFTKTQQRVLTVLYGQPDRSFYANEIVRLAACGTGAVHRELERMAAAGLLVTHRVGNQRHFQVNRDAPIFEEVRSIVAKTFGLVDVLRTALCPYVEKIQVAFVYGSIARQEDTARSDIDLMVLAESLDYPALYTILTGVEQQLGRAVKPVVYRMDELVRKLAEGNAFVTRVLGQPKLFVVGNESDLPKPAQSG